MLALALALSVVAAIPEELASRPEAKAVAVPEALSEPLFEPIAGAELGVVQIATPPRFFVVDARGQLVADATAKLDACLKRAGRYSVAPAPLVRLTLGGAQDLGC